MPAILIVDDLLEDLNALRRGAQGVIDVLGGRVETAQDVESAISMLSQDHFDIVVTDLQLTPEKHNEGWDVLQYARKLEPDTKVIVVTAYPQPQIEARSLALGAYSYVDKLKGDIIDQTEEVIFRALRANDRE